MSRVYSIILTLGAFIIAIDQYTKHLALETFSKEGETQAVLSWFSFTLVYNYGAAFGILRNLPESVRVGFFCLLPLLVLGLLWWAYVRRFGPDEWVGPISMGLIFGGAIGNLIDRIRFGYVVDFIDWFYPSATGQCVVLFHPTGGGCHWPVFNVADAAISLAFVLLVTHSIFQPKKAV